MMASFSQKEDEILIEEIRKHEMIYNLRHKLYKDKDVKNDAWTSVSTTVGRTASECQVRWRTIKDSYFKNKKKLRSGLAALSNRKSKYDTINLQFLDPFQHERKSIVTNVSSTIDVDKSTTESSNLDMEDLSSFMSVDNDILYDPLDNVDESNYSEVKRRKLNITRTDSSISEECKFKIHRQKFQQAVEGTANSEKNTHPIHDFLRIMGNIIAKFPAPEIRNVRDAIYSIVTEKEREVEAHGNK